MKEDGNELRSSRLPLPAAKRRARRAPLLFGRVRLAGYGTARLRRLPLRPSGLPVGGPVGSVPATSRWRSVALAVLFACAALASRAPELGAQPPDPPGIGFTGTVASADSFALVVRADNGKLVTFPIEEPFRVPAGLVPGTRVTVRYEIVDRSRYRLVGVKIAGGPIEHDSTTEPPAVPPAPA